MKTAILFGATGLIGNHLLDLLLKDDSYVKVKIFVRKIIKKNHPKLEIYNINFNKLEKQSHEMTGDECFFCIGTTRKQTPNKLKYIDTELHLPKKIAKIVKENNVNSFIYVSSGGANARSKNLYLQNKGNVENIIIQLSFDFTAIIQPSLLLGNRSDFRLGEKIAQFIFKSFSFIFVSRLKPYKAINAITVANAIIKIVNSNEKGIFFTSDKLEDLSKKINLN
ncbi:NAD(P)H-binding protein [Alphaproteobacteria bacterium]|nr:NAD(P)H-binding protein [Alphaproteobacteria bacterium]